MNEAGNDQVHIAIFLNKKIPVHGVVTANFQVLHPDGSPKSLYYTITRAKKNRRLKNFLQGAPSSGFWKYMPCGNDYRFRNDCDPPFCYKKDLKNCR